MTESIVGANAWNRGDLPHPHALVGYSVDTSCAERHRFEHILLLPTIFMSELSERYSVTSG